MKKITYQCNRQPDHFTLHALFGSVTNNYYKTLATHGYLKIPRYKIWQEGRVIHLILEEDRVPANFLDYVFSHNGGEIALRFVSVQDFTPVAHFELYEYVIVSGVISYGISIATAANPQEKKKKKNRCPVDWKGNFVQEKLSNGQSFKQATFNYLEEKTGLSFSGNQIDQQTDQRFEALHYHDFQKENGEIYSKTNGQSLAFHNVFSIYAKVQVIDLQKALDLEVSSIAQKRSYGFGNLTVTRFVEQ